MQLFLALALGGASALEAPRLPSLSLPKPPSLPQNLPSLPSPGGVVGLVQANPIKAAVPAAGAAAILAVAVSTLTAPPDAREDLVPKDVFTIGFPGQSEVLIPGAPFQEENGWLGMWNWQKRYAPIPKDQTPEAQKVLKANFLAERKKYDIEAQEQGFANAEERGIKEKEARIAEAERIKAEKAAAKAAKKAAEEAAKAQAADASAKAAAEAKARPKSSQKARTLYNAPPAPTNKKGILTRSVADVAAKKAPAAAPVKK